MRPATPETFRAFVIFHCMDAEFYRAEAARRMRLADSITDPEVKARLVALAQEYRELAEELERQRGASNGGPP